VVVHCINSSRINISFHSDTLSYFLTSQSWFLLLDAECVAERQQNTNGLTRTGVAPMIYYIHSEHYYENYISRITEIVIKN